MGGGASKYVAGEKNTSRKISASSKSDVTHIGKNENLIVSIMMPVYYTSECLTPEETTKAAACWQTIIDDTSPEFVRQKGTPGFEYSTAMTYFFDTFYTRFFDIHPLAKDKFAAGLKAQGKHLCKMITTALSIVGDDKKWEEAMVQLTTIHFHRGTRAVEYSASGESLFWTLKKVCGTVVYDDMTDRAWVKIFSKMLKYIVPVAVKFELADLKKKEHEARKGRGLFGSTLNNSEHPSSGGGGRESNVSGQQSSVHESAAGNA